MMKKLMVLGATLIAALALTACGGGKNGEVNVYCYGDYMDPDVIDQFENETGIKVVLTTFDTAEEMYTVIKNDSAQYDVICTSDYMVEKMAGEDLLAKLNKDNIPNISNIDEKYMTKSTEFDPDNTYSVPYQVGTAGIAYNTELTGDVEIDSWEDLWNSKFKESIVMPDSVRDAYMIALLKNGYSLNTTTQTEIDKATEDLIAQKPLVYKYANDSARDSVADGSAALAVVWNGEYSYISELNENVKFVVPKEGTEFFIDSWVIPSNVKNKENAEAWINFMCDAEVAATNFDYLYYTTPNKAALELIDDDAKSIDAISLSDETLSRCHSLKSLPDDVMDMYATAWKKVKAK